ncbi:2Fe-2S iron-sulfur cluster-binding protein [Streptomyces sp. INA 01156]
MRGPGSYADRLLMEADPRRVLEGLALACFACGARRGVVLVRSEYPRALARMREAVEEAYADGHFGPSVHGTDTALDVEVVRGAGSYVAGEETALIASLEGDRGCARPRPPYPTARGLRGAPTVVNNVETLAAVPGSWPGRRRVRPARDAGGDRHETGLPLGAVRPAGAYEVELGTSLLRIVTELGGGMRDGSELTALQVGGPLGGFLAPDALDVPLTTASLAARGAALGHAGLVAFDRRVAPQDVLRHVWEFAAAESCGACSPCRVGSRRGLELAGPALRRCRVGTTRAGTGRGEPVRVRAAHPARRAQPRPRLRRPTGGMGAMTGTEIQVDGTSVAVPEGASLLAAVRAAGSDLPALCSDDRLSPAGSCRTCLVRAAGQTVAACVTRPPPVSTSRPRPTISGNCAGRRWRSSPPPCRPSPRRRQPR